jgi:AFG3 family protein
MKEKSSSKEPDNKTPGIWVPLVFFTILLVATLAARFNWISSTPETTWKQFEQAMLEKNAIEKIVVINTEVAYIHIKPSFVNDSAFKEVLQSPMGDGVKAGPHYYMPIGSAETFERKLDKAQEKLKSEEVNVVYEKKEDYGNWLTWLLPILILFFIFRMLRHGRAPDSSFFNFGRSTARLLEKDSKSVVTFDNVAGLDEAKQEVKEIVDFLKDPTRYISLGAKIPKGVIIVGPPGTGKTLLAKAVAGEAQVPFFSLSGSEFVEMFVGVGASRVRDLFKQAKEKAPCIVFIDEIDAVGRSRGRNAMYSGANDERESTLNQLLTEMDGFGTNSGVIVLAATNRADILDPALLRPGRFDRHIYLELPNQSERQEIFKVHLKPLILGKSVDPCLLAAQTPGFSGADIANICNEAALIAARRKQTAVERQDFIDAIDRIIAGLEKKSKIISWEEKRIIAYHEAGHAVVSWLLQHVDPLLKVSIIPRGKSLGAAWYLPTEHHLRTAAEIAERLTASLAGRAAEEVIFGEVSSGAVDDLEKVTKEAYSMVAYFGFSKRIGNVSFYDSTGRTDMSLQRPYSEDTGRVIDEEVRKLVGECYEKAKTLLISNKAELVALAEMLLEKEIVFKEDLEKLLGKRGERYKLAVVTQ